MITHMGPETHTGQDSKRLVEAVRARPILYVSDYILQGCRQGGGAWRAVTAELEVTDRCSFNIH